MEQAVSIKDMEKSVSVSVWTHAPAQALAHKRLRGSRKHKLAHNQKI